MPMERDPAADAKLFGLVLKTFNIKLTKDIIDQMNKEMGPDCKGQAIPHRIDFYRKKAAAFNPTGSTASGPSEAIKKTKKRAKASESCEEDDDEEVKPKKRARIDYAADSWCRIRGVYYTLLIVYRCITTG
ncbi:uncharacterized protein K452DRAFT_309483 [Aplosporella prunicola CBS 121167]|uniref:Uncharacterized protein n=1 Tax=Aplosporella prunicola CBS 121167 TaxID=1176127 RepID=A0A6A6BCM3_9PEZI|nr:uncharacterized protein K452DRAFT_309483 [Aplosporella prunicola CBS 121167]KAF2141035.1 hypothetical protein K452DRAFT_309483 [Aplosporella prunicola CBS 121167]